MQNPITILKELLPSKKKNILRSDAMMKKVRKTPVYMIENTPCKACWITNNVFTDF